MAAAHPPFVRHPIERVDVNVYRIPTETPESDGTATWDATTIVLATVHAGGASGLGYSYITEAAGAVIRDLLAPCIVGLDAFAIPEAGIRMLHAVRNHGRAGVVACAISAVDVALWDLKAKLLDSSLAALLGPARARVPVYASGGFTSSDLDELASEVAGYVERGYRRIKIKIGRDHRQDRDRIRVLTDVAGPDVEPMIDANGAYGRAGALALADDAVAHGVRYFEEPVSSDDLEGLHLLRERATLAIAAGEYGYDATYFRHMLEAGAVDILQADATRCLGVTGFLEADALCDAHVTQLSAHCAPAIHAHLGAAARRLVHVEHFRDHVRVEDILFEGAPTVVDGELALSDRPGLGIRLKADEARHHEL